MIFARPYDIVEHDVYDKLSTQEPAELDPPNDTCKVDIPTQLLAISSNYSADNDTHL